MTIATSAKNLFFGRITFDQFLVETNQDWQQIAKTLLSRWPAPIEVEDVKQDLMMWAWIFFDKFDANRGVDLGRYLVFNAIDKAKKAIHVARGANRHGNADQAKSRLPKLYDDLNMHSAERSFRSEDCSSWLDLNNGVQQRQDKMIEAKAIVDQIPGKHGQKFGLCFLVSGGDLASVSSLVYEDPELRGVYRLSSEESAKQLTKKVFGWLKRKAINAA